MLTVYARVDKNYFYGKYRYEIIVYKIKKWIYNILTI